MARWHCGNMGGRQDGSTGMLCATVCGASLQQASKTGMRLRTELHCKPSRARCCVNVSGDGPLQQCTPCVPPAPAPAPPVGVSYPRVLIASHWLAVHLLSFLPFFCPSCLSACLPACQMCASITSCFLSPLCGDPSRVLLSQLSSAFTDCKRSCLRDNSTMLNVTQAACPAVRTVQRTALISASYCAAGSTDSTDVGMAEQCLRTCAAQSCVRAHMTCLVGMEYNCVMWPTFNLLISVMNKTCLSNLGISAETCLCSFPSVPLRGCGRSLLHLTPPSPISPASVRSVNGGSRHSTHSSSCIA